MAKRTLVPWGRAVPQSTTPKVKRPKGSSTKQPTPDASLFRADYPPNKPYLWPIEDGKTPSPGAVSDDAAVKNNAAVDYAFERAGYAKSTAPYYTPKPAQQPAAQPPAPSAGNTGNAGNGGTGEQQADPPAQQAADPPAPPQDNTQQAPPPPAEAGNAGNTGDSGTVSP